MENSIGQEWRKIDLHIHTPASHDWNGGEVTPEELVQASIDQGLDAVAITDHNTADWINKIKEAAINTPLKVFPGVEITATGGTGGIHIIALFDPNCDESNVNDLLAKSGIESSHRGKPDSLSPKSVLDLVELIYNAGALPILAHANSSKGALNDMRGEQRTRLMNDTRIASVEVSDTTQYRSLLDGTDINYRRSIAVHRASDNPANQGSGHSLSGIGSRYTMFKMDKLNIDGLRQCFYDPEIRIRTDEDLATLSQINSPYLISMEVSQGFIQEKFIFHEGLNCIIGGKGVGKSLLVEAIRFGLNQTSGLSQIKTDHESKLLKQFGVGCVIKILLRTKSGQEFIVERIYNEESSPITVKRIDGTDFDGNIHELFPIMAYSQTEAVEIARDENAQLELVDQLIDLSILSNEIRRIQDELNQLDQTLTNCLSEISKCDSLTIQIASANERIIEIDRQLGSGTHLNYNKMLAKKEFLDIQIQTLEEWKLATDSTQTEIDSQILNLRPDELRDDELSKIFDEVLQNSKSEIIKSIKSTSDIISEKIVELNNLRIEWDEELEKEKLAYLSWADEVGGDVQSLTKQREDIRDEVKRLIKELEISQEIAYKKPQIIKERDECLDSLNDVRSQIYTERNLKYSEINTATEDRLQLSITQNGNRSLFESRLIDMYRGSHIRHSDLKHLANVISPVELGQILIDQDLQKLIDLTGLDETFAQRVIDGSMNGNTIVDFLKLQHQNLLVDAPTIKLKKQDGNYGELSELSIGQKCSALLMIALTDNDSPIIIDQPEDALDLASVFEDITSPIRIRKDTRQFILTTHNPTVAVAGDADRFQILKATSSTSQIAVHGAIERKEVLDEIILHLEGGDKSFELKTKKYNKFK